MRFSLLILLLFGSFASARELATRNEAGAVVGDTFGGRRVVRVIADTKYVFRKDPQNTVIDVANPAATPVTFQWSRSYELKNASGNTSPSVFAPSAANANQEIVAFNDSQSVWTINSPTNWNELGRGDTGSTSFNLKPGETATLRSDGTNAIYSIAGGERAWETLNAANPSLLPGKYLVESATPFTILPNGQIGDEWEFETGPTLPGVVTFGVATDTFDGVVGVFEIDKADAWFKLIKTGATAYKIAHEKNATIPPLFGPAGAFDAATDAGTVNAGTPDLTLPANQADGSQNFVYFITSDDTITAPGLVAQPVLTGGQLQWWGTEWRYLSPDQVATAGTVAELDTGTETGLREWSPTILKNYFANRTRQFANYTLANAATIKPGEMVVVGLPASNYGGTWYYSGTVDAVFSTASADFIPVSVNVPDDASQWVALFSAGYDPGDIVTYIGTDARDGIYVRTGAKTQPEDATFDLAKWQFVIEAERDQASAWQPAASYVQGDVVSAPEPDGGDADFGTVFNWFHLPAGPRVANATFDVAEKTNWQRMSNTSEVLSWRTVDATSSIGIVVYGEKIRIIGDGSNNIVMPTPGGLNIDRDTIFENASQFVQTIGAGSTNTRNIQNAANDPDTQIELQPGDRMRIRSVSSFDTEYSIVGSGEFIPKGTTAEKIALGTVPLNTLFGDETLGQLQKFGPSGDTFNVVLGTTHQPPVMSWPTNTTSGSGLNFKITEDPDATVGAASINVPDGTQKQIWIVAQQVNGETPSVGGSGTIATEATIRNDAGVVSLVSVPNEIKWQNVGDWSTLSYNSLANTVVDMMDIATANIQQALQSAGGAWQNIDGSSGVDAAAEWTTDTEYVGPDNKQFSLTVPTTAVNGPYVTNDGQTLTPGKRYNLIYNADRTAAASVAAIADDAATVAEIALMNLIGEVPPPPFRLGRLAAVAKVVSNPTPIPSAEAANSRILYQGATTSQIIEYDNAGANPTDVTDPGASEWYTGTTVRDNETGNDYIYDRATNLFTLMVSNASGLRGPPVADQAALTALPARDYERRKRLDDNTEWVFELGRTPSGSDLADDAATGAWVEPPDAAISTFAGLQVVGEFDQGHLGVPDGTVISTGINFDLCDSIEFEMRDINGDFLSVGRCPADLPIGNTTAGLVNWNDNIYLRPFFADAAAKTAGDITVVDFNGALYIGKIRGLAYAANGFVIPSGTVVPVVDNSRIVATGFGPVGGTANADITTFTVPEDGDYEYETNVEGFQSNVLAWNKTLQVRDAAGGGGNLIMSQALTMGASATTAVRKMARPEFGTVALEAGVTYSTRLVHVNEFTDQLSPVTLILRKVPKTVINPDFVTVDQTGIVAGDLYEADGAGGLRKSTSGTVYSNAADQAIPNALVNTYATDIPALEEGDTITVIVARGVRVYDLTSRFIGNGFVYDHEIKGLEWTTEIVGSQLRLQAVAGGGTQVVKAIFIER